MDAERQRVAVLLTAAIIVAPRLRELKDTPALRAAVAESIRVAEYMVRVMEKSLAK